MTEEGRPAIRSALVVFGHEWCYAKGKGQMSARDEILAAASRLGLPVAELERADALALENRAEETFASPGRRPLWERVQHDEAVHDSNAWESIAEFPMDAPTLLVGEGPGQHAFRFQSGAEIVAVLSECSGWVFYVMDESSTFLLCFNDHDFLIGCGAAAGWLRARAARGA